MLVWITLPRQGSPSLLKRAPISSQSLLEWQYTIAQSSGAEPSKSRRSLYESPSKFLYLTDNQIHSPLLHISFLNKRYASEETDPNWTSDLNISLIVNIHATLKVRAHRGTPNRTDFTCLSRSTGKYHRNLHSNQIVDRNGMKTKLRSLLRKLRRLRPKPRNRIFFQLQRYLKYAPS